MLPAVRSIVDGRAAVKPTTLFVFALSLAVACGGPSAPPPAPPSQGPVSPPNAEPAPAAEVPPEAALPVDPDVRVGTLDNGLTYYIKQHRKPEQRAALWLAVNAGAVQEADDQRGLAHFVEHMAFNGTRRFEKMSIVNYLESIGMQFGPDVNAYTSFDETVYMLQLPTDTPKTLATGLDILFEWSSHVSFDPEEVEKERGVVLEEWRLGRGASERIFDKQFPLMFEGSKYAQRLPIGTREILKTAPVSRLVQFYRDWYRPDLMAVVAVGDFEPDAMEAMIKERFSALPRPAETAPAREEVAVPSHKGTLVSVETDPEMTDTSVQIINKMPHRPEVTKSDYRRFVRESLYHAMLNARFSEIGQRPDAPFMFAASFTDGWARASEQFTLQAWVKEGRVGDAIDVLVTEVERVRQHGFTQGEFDRARAETLRSYQNSVVEHEKTPSSDFAAEITRHFLEGEMMPGIAHELRIVEEVLPTFTLGELNELAQTANSEDDRVVLVGGPQKSTMPTEEAVLAAVDSASDKALTPYEDAASDRPLMASRPAPGTVTAEENVDAVGVTVWTLSNGARVVIKPTDFQNDSVSMTGFSPGGHSLAKDRDFQSARFAAPIAFAGGVGDHSRIQLERMMAGKIAVASPWIDELEEGVWGRSSVRDLETMLQLVHLYVTAPRKDADAFSAWKANQLEWVRNRDLDPERVFFDQVSKVASGNHRRRQPLTGKQLDEVSLDRAFDFYSDRFADAGDFTFVFVGNIDKPSLKPLVETYLASLPAAGRRETYRDIRVRQPRGTKKVVTRRGTEPKSFVYLVMQGQQKWSWEAEDDLDMLTEVLRIRLREVLREDMSGVYGVFSGGRLTRRPRPRFGYRIGFGCAPANVKSLKKAVFDVIAEVQRSGASDEVLGKIKEARRRSYETDAKENDWWLAGLARHYRYGTDPGRLLDNAARVDRVTSARVKAAARRYLKARSLVDAVLLPVEGTPDE